MFYTILFLSPSLLAAWSRRRHYNTIKGFAFTNTTSSFHYFLRMQRNGALRQQKSTAVPTCLWTGSYWSQQNAEQGDGCGQRAHGDGAVQVCCGVCDEGGRRRAEPSTVSPTYRKKSWRKKKREKKNEIISFNFAVGQLVVRGNICLCL